MGASCLMGLSANAGPIKHEALFVVNVFYCLSQMRMI